MSKNSQKVINHREKRRKELRDLFDSKCCLCGFDEVQAALEFHHVVPEEKSFGIFSSKASTYSLERQIEEVRKCILVCANCHRGIHNNIYEIPINWKNFLNKDKVNALLEQKQPIKNFCVDCGKEVYNRSLRCLDCSRKQRRKTERPLKDKLKMLIRTKSFNELGRKYGVSSNTVKKWCKQYSLPYTKKQINSYTDEEWNTNFN